MFEKKSGKYGQLSRTDIIREIEAGRLVIEPTSKPVEEEAKIKTASFDISPSCLVMSVKRGSFVRMYYSVSRCAKGHRNPEWRCAACKLKNTQTGKCHEQLYTYIPPRDTVLVLSREYLKLPEDMSGNVYSRVSTVSSGLGHISTTIDPLWKGALLIAISNPSSEPIRLMIQDELEGSVPLATVTLQYLYTPVDPQEQRSTHLPARVDILEKYLFDLSESKRRSTLVKKFWYRFWNIKDYHLTVRLIHRLKKMKDIQPKDWDDAIRELEEEVRAQKIRKNTWRYWLVDKARLLSAVLWLSILGIVVYLIYHAVNLGMPGESEFIGLVMIAIFEGILALAIKR